MGYLYLQLDEEIRRHAEKILASHYQHLRVEVGGARFFKGRGIRLYDLTILQRPARGPRQVLLAIDEVFLQCPTDVDDLMSGELRVSRVVVQRPVLHATRHLDGSWSFQSLLPTPKFGSEPLLVEAIDATLVVADESRPHITPIALHGIDLKMTPSDVAGETAGSIRQFAVEATATRALARRAKLKGHLQPDVGGLDVTIDIRDLEISPELITAVAAAKGHELKGWELYGRLSGNVRLRREGRSDATLAWDSDFALEKGRLVYPLLPRPVTELTLGGQCRNNSCQLKKLTGKCGTAEIVLACHRSGWGAKAPLGLRARIIGLPLDGKLQNVLPPALDHIWKRYAPAGTVDVEIEVTFDGRYWLPKLTIHCRQVSFTEKMHFPYRIEQGRGVVIYQQTTRNLGQLSIDLEGFGQGHPVHVAAELTEIPTSVGFATQPLENKPDLNPVGWIAVSGKQIPVHKQLLDALNEKSRRVVDSLHPEGRFDFDWRADFTSPLQAGPNKSLDLKLAGCAIQFDHFPYPLRDVHGLVTCRDDLWQFHDLTSSSPNRSSTVTITGDCRPNEVGHRLSLDITGNRVPLDDSMRRALLPKLQVAWNQLRPNGRVNFAAHVEYEAKEDGKPEPEIRVALEPDGESVSLDPTFLPNPYRLEKVSGRFDFADGRIAMKNVRAYHGRVGLSTQGRWHPTPDGGWQVRFDQLSADHLTASRELKLAMPPGLRRVLEDLQPDGTFTLHDSSFSYHQPADPIQPSTTSWNVNLFCHQTDLNCGVRLENVSGALQLAGASNGQQGYTTGELLLDSLIWNDMQLTAVRGPLWIDHTTAGALALVGRKASARRKEPLRDLTAVAYGGTVLADLEVRNEGHPQYQLNASVAGANLTRFANERIGGRHDLTGTINGQIQLTGTGRSAHTLKGQGEVQIVDAKIYKLPQLVALLKVLQNRTPDTTAFNRCEAKFTIRGENVHFQPLNLIGDAVSLHGRGQTKSDGNDLQLIFHALVGRNPLPVPVLSSLMGEASEQILRLRVNGTVQDPIINREPLPAVGQVLDQIQEELQPMVGTGDRAAESRFPFWPFR